MRVGGRNGEVLDAGTVSRCMFLEALSACHRSGAVRLPDDKTCEDAVNNFSQYRKELEEKCIHVKGAGKLGHWGGVKLYHLA